MDLRSHYPYWLLKNGLLNNYPSLQQNESCDIAIIGAGISGALTAWYLCKAGFKIIIIDKRDAGTGSTAASTALLQYEIDVPLIDLIQKVGEANAVASYKLCLHAIEAIEKICLQVEDDCSFNKKPSLQYASFKSHVDKLYREFTCREKHGLPVHWLSDTAIKSKYGFNKPAAILSDVAAEVDAYKLTNSILQYCIKHYGLQVFDKTTVNNFRKKNASYILQTDTGNVVNCKNIVIACGYESQHYLPKKIQLLHSTYAIVSEPFAAQEFWHKNSLIWETAEPYLYMRTTNDHRILIGGKDITYTNATERDSYLKQKTIALEKSFQLLFPNIKFKTDFSWAGTFASTKDGLPFIGEYKKNSGVYYALGFGGNGITFSAIAGEIIRDLLIGKENKHAAIFKFNR